MAAIRTLTAEQLDTAIANGTVLLDFWQQTCPPCRALEPRLEAFARRHRSELAFYPIDIDQDQDTPRRFAIMRIPTLILLRDGRQLARLDGLIRDEDLGRHSPAPRRRRRERPSPFSLVCPAPALQRRSSSALSDLLPFALDRVAGTSRLTGAIDERPLQEPEQIAHPDARKVRYLTEGRAPTPRGSRPSYSKRRALAQPTSPVAFQALIAKSA